ncbi:hypothetical protein QYF36_015089 [Acer negundo]|nr:hypothetical protein QYF36_015089 [Acer negundo]
MHVRLKQEEKQNKRKEKARCFTESETGHPQNVPLTYLRVKKGGPNTESSTFLAALLEKFKELGVHKEILEHNIKRATEKGQEAYVEKIYEVYGYGGVSMVVEVLTDKITRYVAAVREVVRDYGGKMADPGSVTFKFRRA